MPTRTNSYKLTLEQTALSSGETPNEQPLTFEFDNHDEIFRIIEAVKSKNLFSESDATEFAIGLKLFSEVLIRNRKNDLFSDFGPAFSEFMKKLKSR